MSKKNTKRALLSSVLTLVLCLSMLIGTTFAWFTDSVTSGVNKIIAGNLDVEGYYGDPKDKNSIEGVDTLFNDVTLWEPGAVAWENLTVVNEGTLVLKYELAINFTNENTVNDLGLSDILKVAIVPGGVTKTTREDVLAEAGEGTLLADFIDGGYLTAGGSTTYGVVIYWEPSSAGIGGSRIANSNTAQNTTITITDSTITAIGGYFGAGIGSGYNTYCNTPDMAPMNTIYIKGDSVINATGGKYAAGIGTGYHVANLDGEIEESVVVNAVSGEKVYKDTYAQAQDIGFGVTDPAREGKDNTCTFKYNGVENGIPSVG